MVDVRSECFVTQELRQLYVSRWEELVTALNKAGIETTKLYGPFLIDVFPEYFRVAKKLMIVGQQTGEWDEAWDRPAQEAVDALMGAYRSFHLGESYLPTPFWGAAWQVFRKLNPEGPSYGFVWNNLIKVDRDGRRPERQATEVVSDAFDLLRDEIRITAPEVVVFFTGPDYDCWLKKVFTGIEFVPVEGLATLSKLNHELLPKAFRAYHPNYVMRMRDGHEYYKRLLAHVP